MKRNFLFMSVLASMFLVGCSQEVITQNGESDGELKKSYLSVKLMSSDDATRADGTTYEDGTDAENAVGKVRFYFFTGSGAPANVKLKNGTYANYYDWPENDDENVNLKEETEKDYIAKKTDITIVINTKDGDKIPQQMVAVINPTWISGNGEHSGSVTLQQLRNETNDYAKSDLTINKKFVMFNSVYGNEQKTAEICAVPITSANLAKSETDAKKHPVTIYVERNVAKVSVEMGTNITVTDGKTLALKDKDGNDLIVDGKQVYLKINGWSLTAETTTGRLGKKIDLSWGYSWWNNFSHKRSCWAINASDAANSYKEKYETLKQFPTALYTNENAEDYTNSNNQTTDLNRTKVILSGTLLDENNNPFTIVRHLGAYFADDESNTLLKKSILAQLRGNSKTYYYEEDVTEDGENKKIRNQIDADDLQIVIAEQQMQENSKNNCYVYAKLTDAAKDKIWYTSSDLTNMTTEDVTTIDGVLANKSIVDRALVWKSGMTYYYYDIIHSNGEDEQFAKGVVRNHIYKTKVTKIAGLGTPVYDPEQVIYPEKPEDNDHYIAAQINILSWHIVSNDYKLEW